MTAQSDPYVRVYYRIIEDPKFTTIYDDKAALGWWMTLLLAADATYPVPANLPLGISRPKLGMLVDAGLVELLPGSRYRIHGLAAEREHRSSIARRGATALHEQRGSSASALQYPNRTDPIQSEPRRSSPTPAGATEDGSKTLSREETIGAYQAKAADPNLSDAVRMAALAEAERLAGLS
jgi:hypothetical protein